MNFAGSFWEKRKQEVASRADVEVAAVRKVPDNVEIVGQVCDSTKRIKDGIVLLGLPTCAPCHALQDKLKTLGLLDSVKIFDARSKDAETFAHCHNLGDVISVPRLYVIKDGKVIGEMTGYSDEEELRELLKKATIPKK